MLRIKGLSKVVLVVGFLHAAVAGADAPRRAPVRAIATRSTAKPAAPVVPTTNAVLMSYQRVGRDIIQLQGLRGTDCTLELWKTFRSIKLDEATTTAEARLATTATLTELQQKIERRRGVTIHTDCLNNPLAAGCEASSETGCEGAGGLCESTLPWPRE